jgi:hypothetical protein
LSRWTPPAVVQVLLHSLASIGFNSQSGGRQSWWQGFVSFRCDEHLFITSEVCYNRLRPPSPPPNYDYPTSWGYET